ncbi:MAG TPA: 30S ribosomal protein S20 [Anaerolineales bacterium]|nr:30S ribosomal protein S20 [Anaerolineales bacterium]
MANTKSAKKRIRQNSRRRVRNARIRTRARSSVRSARQAVEGSDRNAGEVAVKSAIQELDRAASKGVLHRNNAARRKSRLQKQLAKMPSAKK